MRIRISTLVAALFAAAAPAMAAELGMAAPALSIDQWVKGAPVTIAPGDKIYVVEFWATWCGPCRVSIPHLTELQKKFKDKGVVFIGVSDEEADTVRPFVEQQGAAMDYAVAIDPSRKTHEKYMDAFDQRGIPTAFVIDKQARIVWVGHPMAELEEVIEGVLDGSYTVEKAKQREARRAQMMETMGRFETAMNAGDKDKLNASAEEILKTYSDEPRLLNAVAWTLLTYENKSLHNYPLALRMAKVAVDGSKEKDAAIMDTYARALYETGDVKGAISHQQKAVALASSEQMKAELQKTLDSYQNGQAPK
ncbi:MAG: redoxin domain-containing protein [Candidatus Hydrogenedentes bacterium]|nr:redoxin domain-containing protein [Candidatus Hydrogenedentota bacterium]